MNETPSTNSLSTFSDDTGATTIFPACSITSGWTEEQRLAALDRYAILDTGRESAFDDLAILAADILDAPIAVINLVSSDRQWFKAEVGIGTDTLPLDVSICRHAILQSGVMVVPDLTLDARFEGNPLIHVADGLRFYAGALLLTPDGLPLGTVCVLDTKARPDGITDRQARALRVLASQTMARLELKRSEAIAQAERARAEKHAGRLSLIARASSLLLASVDAKIAVRELFDLVGEALRVDVAFNYRCGDGGLGLVAAAGLTPEQERAAQRIEIGETICGIVAATRQPAHVTGILASADPGLGFLRMLGVDSYFSAPLLAGQDVLGTISFGRAGDPFSPGERETLLTLVAQLAIAIERQQAETGLRALNADLERQVIERTQARGRSWAVSPDLMGALNPDGYFETSNPAWFTMLGWSEEEVRQTSIWDLLHPDDVERTRAGLDVTRMDDPAAKLPNRYRCKDGSYRWISWVRVPEDGLVYCTGRDITVQRETEAKLRDEQDFARLALTAVGGVGVWTYDVVSDRFFCDAAISALYGLDPERGAAGLPREDFLANVHPQDRDALRKTMAEGRQRAGEVELEYRLAHPDGSVRWVLSRGITYFDEDGRPLRRTGVGIDMTSQREIEDQLRQSQKMEAVGQLTGGLAHDFNNLLTGMMGNIELLQARVARGRLDDIERFILAAQGAGRRAAALTQRLLAFSRRQTLDPKPTNVNRLIAGMEELLRRTVGPTTAIEVVGAAGLWTAYIDAGQLENALLNLCINARDAMPDGGRLTIETANKWIDDRTARERDMAPGQYLSVCVTDTGTGMSPQTIERAFEPFFTTKPLGEGTGLGLSMIYGFAHQSKGQVRIYSEVGAGTTVCIYLPRHLGEASVVEPEQTVAAAPLVTGATILVVDDEPTIRHLIDEVLNDIGYTVIGAADGAAGLKVLQSSAQIELLITDVGLPDGMNGRQVADAGRTLRPELKVLFITGYAENAAVGNGHMEPGMELLTKPFSMEALASKVANMIKVS